jgi:hypothetical protein
VPRILLFIFTFFGLVLFTTGAFGASGDIRPEPQVKPGVIQFAKTHTTTSAKDETKKVPKIFIRKRFQSQEAYVDTSLLRFVSRTTPLTDK